MENQVTLVTDEVFINNKRIAVTIQASTMGVALKELDAIIAKSKEKDKE